MKPWRALVLWVFVSILALVFFVVLRPTAARTPGAPPPPAWRDDPRGFVRSLWPMLPVLLFVWIFAYRQFRRMRQPITIDITDTGVRLTEALASTDWRWASFIGIVETDNLLLLRRADQTLVMIPKRAVPPGQLDALRLRLTERIPAPGAFPVLPPRPPSVSA